MSGGVPSKFSMWSPKFLNVAYTAGVASIQILPPPEGKSLVFIALSGCLRSASDGEGPSAFISYATRSIQCSFALPNSSALAASPASTRVGSKATKTASLKSLDSPTSVAYLVRSLYKAMIRSTFSPGMRPSTKASAIEGNFGCEACSSGSLPGVWVSAEARSIYFPAFDADHCMVWRKYCFVSPKGFSPDGVPKYLDCDRIDASTKLVKCVSADSVERSACLKSNPRACNVS